MNNYFSVPVPNLGKCEKRGQWDHPADVTDCQACISNSTPDYPLFYCDGQCMSKYNLNGACSTNSLVAKNTDQCSSPCYQVAPPSVLPHQCEDMFDCPNGFICDKGMCVKEPKQPQNNMPLNLRKGNSATKKPSHGKNKMKYVIPMVILLVVLILIITFILFTKA